MRKSFEIEDLDCACCAAKMEKAIKELDGVRFVSVSFLAQKLTLDAVDEKFDSILAEAVRICRRVEPDCRVIVK